MAEPGRSTFGPVVLAGLAGAGLAAVAGTNQWVRPEGDLQVSQATFGPESGFGEAPAVGALALVVLACWGVVLVTRGRVRRAVVAFAALVSAGIVVTAILGLRDLDDSVPSALERAGVTGPIQTDTSAWFWVSLVGAAVDLVAGVVAVRVASNWPEMGRKYDAPRPSPTSTAMAEDQSNLELWESIADGRDPTDPDDRTTP